MDNPPVNFVSLPENLKLQIFKELDWQTLKNLKLVCKDFCLTIEANIKSLDRPKVYSMSIGYDGTKISSILYRLMLPEIIEGRGPLKTILFSSDDEGENFLKNIDCTEIKGLCLRKGSNVEYISVHCQSYSGGEFSMYNFSTRLQNERSFKMRLYIRINSSGKFGILYDSDFLRNESLKKLGFFEKNGIHSVGKKIVMDLLTGYPMLEYKNANTSTRNPLDIQIMNHLFELGFFNPENTCGRQRFKLHFNEVAKFGYFGKNFYKRLLDKIKFNNNLVKGNNRNVYSVSSSIKCSVCGVEHEISILYRKKCKQLCIQSF